MKRFIFSILFVSVFCIGLGTLADKAGAKFKSDEKALAIIRDARQAIGGDAALAAVKSLVITGQTTMTFKADGVDRTEQGETEIAMQFPDKLTKMIKIGHGDETGSATKVMKQVDVVVVAGNKDGDKMILQGEGEGAGAGAGQSVKRVILKKDDGTVQDVNGPETAKIVIRGVKDGNATFTATTDKTVNTEGGQVMLRRVGGEGDVAGHHDGMRHNEMLRLALGLLLTSPDGMDVSYTYGGESDVDGTACNVVVAEFGGSAFRLFIGKSSNLPVMMSYTGAKMSKVMMTFHEAPKTGEGSGEDMLFTRKVDAPPETAEFNVKFSDYRSTGGVQLPYKWVQTVGGAPDETFDVTSYDLNPANIAEKFAGQHTKVRMEKPTN